MLDVLPPAELTLRLLGLPGIVTVSKSKVGGDWIFSGEPTGVVFYNCELCDEGRKRSSLVYNFERPSDGTDKIRDDIKSGGGDILEINESLIAPMSAKRSTLVFVVTGLYF